MSKVVNKLREGAPTDSQDLLNSGGWVQLPRRIRLGVVGALFMLLVGAVGAHFSLKSQAEAATLAAQDAKRIADDGPVRVLREVKPRLDQLERDRDVARAERRVVAEEIGAVRLYLCRECERRNRRRASCDDICRRK